ncbi:MAG TPA: hypothetical protein VMF91_25450 [Bryobacteraceae bacterium]|nr:hypothetical protein [Bryobacteraceae bacterium]
MIFMTSNLGASEMSALDFPKLGFHPCEETGRGRWQPRTPGGDAEPGGMSTNQLLIVTGTDSLVDVPSDFDNISILILRSGRQVILLLLAAGV